MAFFDCAIIPERTASCLCRLSISSHVLPMDFAYSLWLIMFALRPTPSLLRASNCPVRPELTAAMASSTGTMENDARSLVTPTTACE